MTKRLIEHARTQRETRPQGRDDLERELVDVQAALNRLADAVAAGADVPTLVEAIKEHEEGRRVLQRRLEALSQPVVTFDAQLDAKLCEAVGEWRETLGRQVPQARQIVSKLLVGRIKFTPEGREGQRGFRFEATGTVEKLVAGLVRRSFHKRWRHEDLWRPVQGWLRAPSAAT